MSQLIKLNISNKGSSLEPLKNGPIEYIFDVDDIAIPIEFDSNLNRSVFQAVLLKDLSSSNISPLKDRFAATDTLADIKAQSSDLLLLTVVKRNGAIVDNQDYIFNCKYITENIRPTTSNGSSFLYIEQGDPVPVEYEVTNDLANIITQQTSSGGSGGPALAAEIAARISGDLALSNRTSILENNEYKITYFEQVNSLSGTVTIPAGATIMLNQYPGGVDALVSKQSAGVPTGEQPETSGGIKIDVTSFNSTGNYALSGNAISYPVAIIYTLKIKAINFQNLNILNILDHEVNSETLIKVGDIAGGDLAGEYPDPKVKQSVLQDNAYIMAIMLG